MECGDKRDDLQSCCRSDTHWKLRFQSRGKCKSKVIVNKNLIRHKERRRERKKDAIDFMNELSRSEKVIIFFKLQKLPPPPRSGMPCAFQRNAHMYARLRTHSVCVHRPAFPTTFESAIKLLSPQGNSAWIFAISLKIIKYCYIYIFFYIVSSNKLKMI